MARPFPSYTYQNKLSDIHQEILNFAHDAFTRGFILGASSQGWNKDTIHTLTQKDVAELFNEWLESKVFVDMSHDRRHPRPPAKMCKGCNLPELYCTCNKKKDPTK